MELCMSRGMLLLALLRLTAAAMVVTPEDHGAVGDGKTDDWAAITSAMAECALHSPCTVLFSKSYLSGPIKVSSSQLTLRISGTLAALPKAQYDAIKLQRALIYSSTSVHQVRITGGGTITSHAPVAWWVCKITGCWRPHLIDLNNVVGLQIDNIQITDSPNHHIEVVNCTAVRVDAIHIKAPLESPNTDGINFYGGVDQMLSNSVISNGDDCVSVVPIGLGLPICVAQPDLFECSGGNVVVKNVSCNGGHGISIGGVRHGTVSNVSFVNMTATGGFGNTQGEYSTGGLRIKSYPNSTGRVYDIRYDDITLDGVYLPLQLLGHYCPWPCNTKDGNTSVKFSNISFTNIRGSGRRTVQGSFLCSALAPCENITLDNVVLGKQDSTFACQHVDLTVQRSSPSACSAAVLI